MYSDEILNETTANKNHGNDSTIIQLPQRIAIVAGFSLNSYKYSLNPWIEQVERMRNN
jgi:hypothetical protein